MDQGSRLLSWQCSASNYFIRFFTLLILFPRWPLVLETWKFQSIWCCQGELYSVLSLAVPPWVGTMSTLRESWDVNKHTAWCTSPVSMVLQCKLVSGWGLRKRRSAPLYGPYGSERTLRSRRNVREKSCQGKLFVVNFVYTVQGNASV